MFGRFFCKELTVDEKSYLETFVNVINSTHLLTRMTKILPLDIVWSISFISAYNWVVITCLNKLTCQIFDTPTSIWVQFKLFFHTLERILCLLERSLDARYESCTWRWVVTPAGKYWTVSVDFLWLSNDKTRNYRYELKRIHRLQRLCKWISCKIIYNGNKLLFT